MGPVDQVASRGRFFSRPKGGREKNGAGSECLEARTLEVLCQVGALGVLAGDGLTFWGGKLLKGVFLFNCFFKQENEKQHLRWLSFFSFCFVWFPLKTSRQ